MSEWTVQADHPARALWLLCAAIGGTLGLISNAASDGAWASLLPLIFTVGVMMTLAGVMFEMSEEKP